MSPSTCAEGGQSEITVNESKLSWDVRWESEVGLDFVEVAYLGY